MKKLKLNLENLQGGEILSREQLKKVVGGYYGSGSEVPDCSCNSASDCPTDKPKCYNGGSGVNCNTKDGKIGYCDK